MTKGKIKQTLRQRWLPTLSDADEALNGIDPGKELFYVVKKWARTLVCAGAVLYIGNNVAFNNYEYSNGLRVGMVNKIAEKGVFWKTFEGQMALEGIVSEGNSSGANVWDFSIDRGAYHGENPKELAEKIRSYAESGTKVKLTYTQPLAVWPWRAGTSYLVQSVEPVEKSPKEK